MVMTKKNKLIRQIEQTAEALKAALGEFEKQSYETSSAQHAQPPAAPSGPCPQTIERIKKQINELS